MYYVTVYMDFYFNISMDSTYAGKYYILMCFHMVTWIKLKKLLTTCGLRCDNQGLWNLT
jgi:hypothetical protein